MGTLFGFFAYATCYLNNLATLKNLPAKLALIDMLWGAALGGVVASAGKWAMNWSSPP